MRQYSQEFKREAVRLVTEEGYTRHAAAKAVGVCSQTIAAWVGKHADEMPNERVYASQHDELETLRAEVRTLRMERDLLKKAAAYFATGDHR